MTIIAFFGLSCTGKTTAAKEIASAKALKARHCGDIVREMAKSRGIAIPDLGVADHQRIDTETVAWAQGAQSIGIVDGCFLHHVLSDIRGVLLVELRCASDERERRLSTRSGRAMSIADRDDDDRRLQSALYTGSPRQADAMIDTTNLSVEQMCSEIMAILKL